MTKTRADYAAGIFHRIIKKLEKGKRLTRFHRRALGAAAGELRLSDETQRALVMEFAGKRALEQLGRERVNGSLVLPGNIRLLPKHIITIDAGTYEGLGEPDSTNNPIHSVTLKDDCRLVVLNYDLLGKFKSDERVSNILRLVNRREKAGRGDVGLKQCKNNLVTDLTFLQALGLRRVINQAIVSEGLHLRIPRERIIDVLVERHREQCEELGLACIPTSSQYKEDGVMVDEPGAKLLLKNIEDSDNFVYRLASLPKFRNGFSVNQTPSNTTVLYEIAPLE